MSKYTTIYIVRHGETEWNVKKLLQGHKDSPLTLLGKKQAQNLAYKIKHIKFDAMFSSDLFRAHHTAKIIAKEHNLIVKTTNLLRERSFGKYEGKTFSKFNASFKELYLKNKNITDQERLKLKLAPDIESPQEAISRTFVFLREMSLAYVGKTVLMVTHGGVIRYLLIHLGFGNYKNLPPESITNTAYVKLESDGIDFFVKETFGVNKKEISDKK
jgi:phosphoserine phosphatase